MGHKAVCLECKVSFNQGTDFRNRREVNCPHCHIPMILLPHRFKPPKKSEDKKWETVKFLISKGFYYQHIYEYEKDIRQNYVAYPTNLKEAKEFVKKYQNQAIK